jgi:hypothetical protein
MLRDRPVRQLSWASDTKHGVLTGELVVDEMDKSEFETLRGDLLHQLSPATILQEVGFGRILSSIWKTKLALRLEKKQLKATFGQFEEEEDSVPKGPPPEGFLPPKWYYASRSDLRDAIRLLLDLRKEVQENGWLPPEEWKPEIVRAFGEEYFSLLTRWVPMDVSAIQMANMLAEKAKKFGSPSPPVAEATNTRVVVDPQLSWQMGLKLIDLTQQHLKSLLRIDDLRADSTGQERHTSAVELATRYYTTATRELERAVTWYQYLKEHQL